MLLCGKQIGSTALSHSQPCYVIGVYTWADWTKHGQRIMRDTVKNDGPDFYHVLQIMFFCSEYLQDFMILGTLFFFLTGCCFEQFGGWLFYINEMQKVLQLVVRTKWKCMAPWALPDSYHLIKGSLDEKLPIYEQDPKSKRLDSFEKRFVRD